MVIPASRNERGLIGRLVGKHEKIILTLVIYLYFSITSLSSYSNFMSPNNVLKEIVIII